MAQASAVVDVLKRELKARGLTYAVIAQRIAMSEASVKRMFSTCNFTLERIDAICRAAGIEFSELTRDFNREQNLLTQLTQMQEREIVDDSRLFLVAVSVLNLMSFDDIVSLYTLSPAEVVGLLARLDRIGVIELLPNNRFKLKIARTFAWIPNGPIQTAFKNNAGDFFDSDFAGPAETMLLLNGRLSRANALALVDKLKRVAREFSAQHIEDAQLPLDERPPISILLACRPWQPSFMRPFIKARPAVASRRISAGRRA
jgi:transcriptional regulator with XRE-family HTH domain